MNKYLSVLLLLSISFSAFAQNSTNKIKAVVHNDVLIVKLLLKSPMIGEEESKGGGIWGEMIKPIDYISHITVILNKNEILDIKTNPFLSRNPVFKFKIKDTHISDKGMLIVKYNSGEIKTNIFTIKKLNSTNEFIQQALKQKLDDASFWNAKTVDEAIKILYGQKAMISDVIDVQVPKLSGSSFIPVSIKTDINLESIVVLMSTNPRSVVAKIDIPSGQLIQFDIRVKPIYPIQVSKNYEINTGSYITVVGKARDGKIYKTTKFSELTMCVNSGGGLEDYQIEKLYKIQHQ